MTALLGYSDGVHIWVGADSAASDGGWSRFTIRERKVWRAGDFLFACTGRMRIGQLLQSCFVPPEHHYQVAPIDYFVAQFIPALQALLKEHNETMTSDASNTGLIIGYCGTIYHLDSWFNINAVEPQIIGDGSGGDTARGAFQAFLDCGIEPREAMLKALQVAADYELTVAPPFYVETI